MRRPGFLIDRRFQDHHTGGSHPEAPVRLAHILEEIEALRIAERWRRVEPRPAALDRIGLVHTQGHIERIRRAASQAPARLDPDTTVGAMSFEVALLAAGGVLECVDAVCRGEIDCAFAFVRPPGHHAEPDRAMGFCLFNNVALAAAHLRRAHGLERVAVVDIDVHHGNGTQAIFYNDPGVLFLSSHQYPFYPGTGSFGETGLGDGWGYTLNFPLPAGAGDEVFVPLYGQIVAPILEQYRPQMILVSAGFDAYRGDPLGGLSVSGDGYGSAAASLMRAADACCEGRICFVLEGGYSPAGLRECARAVLMRMESPDPKETTCAGSALFGLISEHARHEFGEHWKW